MSQQPPQLAKAFLQALPDKQNPQIPVHFNPVSLVYTVENSVANQSSDPKKKQYAATFSGKLSMDLQFDTTDTGTDVRFFTNQVARFMQATGLAAADAGNKPSAKGGGGDESSPPKAPPVLLFQWGSYRFQGVMESFKETIDFFSPDGVALRALVSISLARQDQVFDEKTEFASANTSGSLVPTGSGDSAQSMATRGGDPRAARQLASDNGLESLRFTGGTPLQVSSGAQLKPPAGFVSAPSAGAGLGFSAGAQLSAKAGITGGGGLFGAKASAGVSATRGAFAGLQSGTAVTSSTVRLDPTQMLPSTSSAGLSTFAGASFSLGGSANGAGSVGLSTDVGAKFSFKDRLTFDFD
jgi:hypothetical protein